MTLQQFHDVRVQKSSHRVRVTPFISGQLDGLQVSLSPSRRLGLRVSRLPSRLQVQTQLCSRTVLLTGIPDVLDPEVLQDFLVVHFQKASNGGGEVLQCLYNPLGRRGNAVFRGRSNV